MQTSSISALPQSVDKFVPSPSGRGLAFAEVESDGFEGVDCYQESDRGHGRIEERKYYAVPVPAESELRQKWQGLETFMMGVFHRSVKDKTSVQVRYMISGSLPYSITFSEKFVSLPI